MEMLEGVSDHALLTGHSLALNLRQYQGTLSDRFGRLKARIFQGIPVQGQWATVTVTVMIAMTAIKVITVTGVMAVTTGGKEEGVWVCGCALHGIAAAMVQWTAPFATRAGT